VSDVSYGNTCPETITRTYRITDDCGNATDVTQTITVDDTTSPVFTLPADVTIACSDDSSPANTGSATATDNCDPAPGVTYSDVEIGTCPSGQTILRTWTATDTCGNVASADQVITLTVQQHTITTLPGANGTIHPHNPVVNHGQSIDVIVTADADHTIDDLWVDGISVGTFGPGVTTTTQSFAGVVSDHTVQALFTRDTGSLQVILGPVGATSSGAQWRLTSGPDQAWYASGDQIDNLAVGHYSIEFAPVLGFETPGRAVVVVKTGLTAHHQDYRIPATVFIPGGTYQMGNLAGIGGNTITVDSFLMKPGEVTIDEYQAYADATGRARPSQPHPDPSLPVSNISWTDAVAYLNWCSDRAGLHPAYTFSDGQWVLDRNANGYRLPTEAEWEYATRGGIPDALYPWGNTIDSSRANYDIFPTLQLTRNGDYAPNGYGLFDVAGNVREWVHDWYSPSLPDGVTNPTGPATGAQRVLRGGSWVSPAGELICPHRTSTAPASAYSDLGFRWVLSVTNDDTDGDGMPDWWEQLHFDHPTDPAPGDDPDKDGSPNGDEYSAGTDPTDETSTIRIVDIFPLQGAMVIVWPSVAGKTYTLDVIDEMKGQWEPLETSIPADPPFNSYLDYTDTLPRCFYRVRVE
jgi:formylglycine-generating enzyme required for sulfatase activity